ncbi:hypothetical protein NQ314_008840, partial [Rhamnusium bicolor]
AIMDLEVQPSTSKEASAGLSEDFVQEAAVTELEQITPPLFSPSSAALEAENYFLKQEINVKDDKLQYLLNRMSFEAIKGNNELILNNAVCAELMLFVTLRFFATGSFLQVVGDFVGIDKSMACRIVYKVSRANAGLHTMFIRMSTTDGEMSANSVEFYTIAPVLHNIARLLNEEMPPIDAEEEEAIQLVNDIEVGNVRDVVGGINNVVRYQLIHEYFHTLL